MGQDVEIALSVSPGPATAVGAEYDGVSFGTVTAVVKGSESEEHLVDLSVHAVSTAFRAALGLDPSPTLEAAWRGRARGRLARG
jgi:hypothetical protein